MDASYYSNLVQIAKDYENDIRDIRNYLEQQMHDAYYIYDNYKKRYTNPNDPFKDEETLIQMKFEFLEAVRLFQEQQLLLENAKEITAFITLQAANSVFCEEPKIEISQDEYRRLLKNVFSIS